MEEISSSSSPPPSDIRGPAIDRHNPIIRDPKRIAKLLLEKKKKNDDLQNVGYVVEKESCDDDFISPVGSPENEVFSTPLVDPLEVSEHYRDIKKERQQDIEETSSPCPASIQVVILRVSLHCKGCERKMRKHLSKMEGVSSFNIDFAAKRVMVTGYVTPLSIMSSISKVKNVHLSIEEITTL